VARAYAASRRSYSCRNATIGSTPAARRTGTHEASSATAIIAPPPIASGNALSNFKSEKTLVRGGPASTPGPCMESVWKVFGVWIPGTGRRAPAKAACAEEKTSWRVSLKSRFTTVPGRAGSLETQLWTDALRRSCWRRHRLFLHRGPPGRGAGSWFPGEENGAPFPNSYRTIV
jgi:hypothetical protein